MLAANKTILAKTIPWPLLHTSCQPDAKFSSTTGSKSNPQAKKVIWYF